MLIFALVTASCIVLVSPVRAAPDTIVVPDDYPTIASSIGNASSGDTILVRSGTSLEHSLTIDKTLILIGENASDTIISDIDEASPIFGSSIMAGPTAIWISANNVTISGFTIDNGNHLLLSGRGWKPLASCSGRASQRWKERCHPVLPA